ncbi:putative leader peptide [Streptomyces sp. Tu 3180]|uniref:putative leader peptide n=1 Tax=Streptomyces sp. Tu 3180 TaxID=2682611 RepID=UPI0032613CCA
MNTPLGRAPPSATIPTNQLGKLGIRGGAMGTLDRADLSFPLLTSRRHIDLGRTSSAICRPA